MDNYYYIEKIKKAIEYAKEGHGTGYNCKESLRDKLIVAFEIGKHLF